MSNAKEICEGVPRPLLDSPVSDIHLSDIASHITNWQELAPYLDLSEVEEKDIVDSYPNRPKLQRRELLRKWKESNGNKATYRKLICILCSQSRANTAQRLKELLVQPLGTSQGDTQALMDNFRKYLCDCYISLKHPSLLQWPFLAHQAFVEIDLFDAPLLSSRTVDDKSLTPLSIGRIFDAGDQTAKRKVIFVEGIAGVGKSTFCWYIRKEWAARNMFQDVRLIMHISLSDIGIHSARKLEDLIPHPSEEVRGSVAKAIADSHGKGVCFLLDACDEAKQLTRSSFFFQFIAGTDRRSMLPFATLLLTSRPGIPSDLMKCATGRVLIKGFKSLDDYIKRVFSDDSKKRAQLFQSLEMKPELYSLCHLPLHAVILVHIFDYLGANLPTTRTGLFHPLVCNFLIRHMQARSEYQIDTIRVHDLSTDLPADIYSALYKISRLAFQSLISRDIIFTQSMLRQAEVDPILHDTFGFLQSNQRVTMYGLAKCYKFSHLSLQEFLAAFFITQLSEQDQFSAFQLVYKQNPVSPILIFYAGLTKLVSEKACTLLLQVLKKQLDFSNVVQVLQQKFDRACDVRPQLLALMNCLYETKKRSLISCITLPPRHVQQQDTTVLSSTRSNCSQAELPLAFMALYPTDCLSIAYFVRLACAQMVDSEVIHLNLSHCLIKAPEIRALCFELHKRAQKHNVFLNISGIRLTTEALHSIKTIFNSRSAIGGLMFTGYLAEDMQLALKYIIEGVVSYHVCRYISINDLHAPIPVLHHLVLLLVSGHCLTMVDLTGSPNLFKNPKAVAIFCATLRHTSINRLLLDGCRIDDQALTYLADVLVNGCLLSALDIGWNPYTAEGLTEFLRILNNGCMWSVLTVLSTNNVLNDEHRSLVEEFNACRKPFLPFVDDLIIGCKDTRSRDRDQIIVFKLEFVVRTQRHRHFLTDLANQ